MWKWMVGTCAVAALAACGSDGGETRGLPEGHHDLGDGVSVVIHEVRDPAEPPEEITANPDARWVGLDLEYFNATDEVVDMAMSHAVYLHTDAGHQATLMANYDLPEMPSVIPPGRTARGWMVFEVADGEEPAQVLLYGSDVGGEPISVDV